VDDAGAVRLAHGLAGLEDVLHGLRDGQRALVEQGREIAAVQELHDHVGRAALQRLTGTGAGDPGGAGGSGAGSNSSSAGIGGGFTTGTSTGAGAGGSTGCSAASQLVYVLSTDNEIWSFDPPSKQFTNLFALGCVTPNDVNQWSPNSMAVDRNAVAWINYVGTDPITLKDKAGLVFKVDINNKTCESAPTVTLPSAKWYRLGMGFSSDTVGGTAETLYVTGTGTNMMANSPGLGKIDMSTKAVVPIGQFTGSTLNGQSAELTGTGDAKLFGFFTTTPVHVAQIDPMTGATAASTDNALPQVETPAAWAFSFWGGDFYLYTAPDPQLQPNRTSNVTKYTPGGTANTSYMTNVGFTIVGAGVSTCAPLKPPT
jgi:hypothetical protein